MGHLVHGPHSQGWTSPIRIRSTPDKDEVGESYYEMNG